jgi:NADPH-dependent 2,4-dienoyl-CoA reductase/sulfur reductase-like enzyme
MDFAMVALLVRAPPQKMKSPQSTIYDVLIVGGGYAGLAAARDLTNAGKF